MDRLDFYHTRSSCYLVQNPFIFILFHHLAILPGENREVCVAVAVGAWFNFLASK